MDFNELKEGMRVIYKNKSGIIARIDRTDHSCLIYFDSAFGGTWVENHCIPDIQVVDNDQTVKKSSSYYDIGGISVNDVIRAKLTPEEYAGWCKGNILKYTMRAKYKEDEQKDLKKAADYMRWLIESKEGKDDELHPRSF